MSVDEWVSRLTAVPTELTSPSSQSAVASESAPASESGAHAGDRWWQSVIAQRVALWVVIATVIVALAVHGHRLHRRDAVSAPAVAVPLARAPRAMTAPPLRASEPVPTVANPAAGSAAVPAAPAHETKSPLQPPAATAASTTESAARESVARKPNVVSAVGFRVRPGQKFAEVLVRRSDAQNGEGGFTWWTVAGSAVPGTDFVPQPPTAQSFSRGRHVSNLFVRLLPNPARSGRREFHVEIGKAGSDDISAPIARANIAIPPQP